MPPAPASSPSPVPAASIDPRVENLEGWWKDLYVLAVRDAATFRARVPHLEREAKGGPAGEPPDVADARLTMLRIGDGIAHWAASENDAAEIALQGAIASLENLLPRATTPGLPHLARRLIGNCHVYLGHVAHNRGDYAEALRAYLHVREIARFGGYAPMRFHALANISMIYGEAGMWEQQLEFAREARRVGEELNNEVGLCQLDMMVSHAYRKLRDFPAARQVAEGAIAVFRRAGWKGEELDAQLRLAMIAFDEGRAGEAAERLRDVAGLSVAVDRPHFEAARRTELGRALLARGELAEAASTLADVTHRFVDAMNFTDHADARLVLARVHLASRNLAAAESEAREALHLLARTGLPSEFEADVHALLAEAAGARSDWETACREERARYAAYARHFNHQSDLRTRMLAVQHQIDIARAAAERERVERQRLEGLLADVAARLASVEARPRARNADEITAEELQPLGLTPRESEVLLWVARGKTNDEIATILGRSDAVVKKHLKSIYQKLGVENRLSAAAAALRGSGATR